MANGDPFAIAKLIPNGQVPAPTPKAGNMNDLDTSRTGSANNTAKNYTNPKKLEKLI